MQTPLENEAAAPIAVGNGGKGRLTSKSNADRITPQERWKRANPKKVWAQQCLRSALKRGLVIQEPCRVCGNLDAEAHHPDYERPMDVDWLCRRDHQAEHKRLKCEAAT
ncbi:hypothetical protein [Mesorhizobium sp. B2-6-5]|uniref:hypothetical protein n=1 Tax=Mesorhizobium sp. B2-6-5 TaxID=2589912 RepID=UPI001129B9B8|nr:hypothetical protein [Mesorhizobium sp. B2-6-5]TPJ34255.1 hypothetical protein FJ432_29985 [Mesorhizobium sp. B2-6-5]